MTHYLPPLENKEVYENLVEGVLLAFDECESPSKTFRRYFSSVHADLHYQICCNVPSYFDAYGNRKDYLLIDGSTAKGWCYFSDITTARRMIEGLRVLAAYVKALYNVGNRMHYLTTPEDFIAGDEKLELGPFFSYHVPWHASDWKRIRDSNRTH